MLTGSFSELYAADCIQTGADVEPSEAKAELRFGPMFKGLMVVTGGDPCDGCPAYHGGKCKAFKRFNTRAQPSAPEPRYESRFVKPAARCPECGLKIRRAGHKDGQDHARRAGKTAKGA